MALNTAGIQLGGAGIAAGITHLSIHTATPNGSGSNESSAARVAAGLTSAAGVVSCGTKNFTGGAASGAAQFVGFWSASTAGTFLGFQSLTGDQTFNAAGQYTLNSLTLTGSAT